MTAGRTARNRCLVSRWFFVCVFLSWVVSAFAVVEGLLQLSTGTSTNKLFLRPKQTLLSDLFSSTHSRQQKSTFVIATLRGGQQEESGDETISQPQQPSDLPGEETAPTKEISKVSLASIPAMSQLVATLTSMGKVYGRSLEQRPILTKSVTACCIFSISDYLAQRLEKTSSSTTSKQALNWTRLLSAGAVGLLYFGPAAHYWYEMIFRLLPGTSLVSTLQKAAMGQLFFGPSFTCIFFAVSLLQAGDFSLKTWASKIRLDLPGAWLAGAGFWPLVDLVSYSVIPKKYIPLFVNLCSLVWTIYLSLVANRGAGKSNRT